MATFGNRPLIASKIGPLSTFRNQFLHGRFFSFFSFFFRLAKHRIDRATRKKKRQQNKRRTAFGPFPGAAGREAYTTRGGLPSFTEFFFAASFFFIIIIFKPALTNDPNVEPHPKPPATAIVYLVLPSFLILDQPNDGPGRLRGQRFTEFYRVLAGYVDFFGFFLRISPGQKGFFTSFIGFYQVLLSFTGFLTSFIGLYQVLLSFTEF